MKLPSIHVEDEDMCVVKYVWMCGYVTSYGQMCIEVDVKGASVECIRE